MYKVLLLLVTFLFVSCSKTYTKELSVREMSQVNLKPGTVITFENDVIILSGKSEEIVDDTECYLDFRECTAEGICNVYVQCDREVKIDTPVIEVGVEYLYGKFSDIPEFSNNFMNGEYHASDEYPRLMTKDDACSYFYDRPVGWFVINCERIKKDYAYPDNYVVYPTDLLNVDLDAISDFSYADYEVDVHNYRFKNNWSNGLREDIMTEEDIQVFANALKELEIIAFYPNYFNYYADEKDCHVRRFWVSYKHNDGLASIRIIQYFDSDVAFVSGFSGGFNDDLDFQAYVKVNDFFNIVAGIMEDAVVIEGSVDNSSNCPLKELLPQE